MSTAKITVYYACVTLFTSVKKGGGKGLKKSGASQCFEENFKVIIKLAVYTILHMLGSK